MHKVLILAAGLALIGTSAMSQSTSRDRDDYSRGHWYDGGYDRWDRGKDDMRRSMRDDDDNDDQSGRNARFFVRNGDTQLRVVCGDRESTQACIDSALRLFDRVQSQPRTTGSSGPSAPPSTSSPQ